MSNVTGIGAISQGIDLGHSGSLQLRFAKLQLALSEMSKQSAMKEIDGIEKSQEEQKLVAKLLQDARQLQADAKAKMECTEMTPEMVDYMTKNNLAWDKTGDDYLHDRYQWDVAINSLKSHLDQLGTNTQQKMVFVQDFMGQYNSYLQGSNSAIQQSNQTLADLARLR
jgi:hypothetical protein